MRVIPLEKAWHGEANCLHCAVRGSVLFSGLEESDFRQVHRLIDDLYPPANALLYRHQQRGRHIFTIRTGVVKLVRYLPDGSQRIVRILRSTDVAGLEALLDQPYQHDAVALTALEVCRIPAKMVNDLALERPKLHTELMKRWQRALNEADAWLTQFSTGTARQRMARLMMRLADPAHDCSLELFCREDIGAMLGITTETASRVIAEFKRRGLLQERDDSRLLKIQGTALRIIADGI